MLGSIYPVFEWNADCTLFICGRHEIPHSVTWWRYVNRLISTAIIIIGLRRRASTFYPSRLKIPPACQLPACAKPAPCLRVLFLTCKKRLEFRTSVGMYAIHRHSSVLHLPCFVCELIGGSILHLVMLRFSTAWMHCYDVCRRFITLR